MTTPIARTLVLLFLSATALHAQEPQLINYQGRVTVNGVNFDGSGLFKFAIVDATGTTTYWSNDGTSTAGSEPAAAVTLTVTGGDYSVVLGNTTLLNMAVIPTGVFNNYDVFLRVWFNDGSNGSQLLTPDQRLPPDCATPAADGWQQRNVDGTSPSSRFFHTAVWTGSEMIVWGGRCPGNLNTGGRYKPAGNSWTALSTTDAPAARAQHTAVWTGSEMIVWGGTLDGVSALNTGGRYSPAGDSWTEVTGIGAPTGRYDHTAVWTGNEMIVWGGETGTGVLNTGGRYNPSGDGWTALSTSSALTNRSNHTAVWTGNEMVVWGGGTGRGTHFATGGRYNPAGDIWTAVTTSNAPTARSGHKAVWTGSEMIVWSGYGGGGYVDTGGRYNPTGNIWTEVTTIGAPAGRERYTAVWTGSEMIVWGGQTGGSFLNTGGRYYPAGDHWTPVIPTGSPAARGSHTAVWTGNEMIVWGGGSAVGCSVGTFSYTTPNSEPLRITGAELSTGNLTLSFPSVTGCTYTLWRSDSLAAGTWTNTGLAALAGTGATLTFTVPATTPASRFFRVHADPHR